MPRITVSGTDRIIEACEGRNLMELLLEEGFFIDNPCSGKGLCGKCRIRIEDGAPEPADNEKSLLSEEELASGVRLSCLVVPEEDMKVSLMQKNRKHRVLTGGYIPDFEYSPAVRKVCAEIHRPTLEDQTPFEDQLELQTGASFDELALMHTQLAPGQVTLAIRGDRIIAVEKGDTRGRLFGAAIDIGTTTVVCSLIDINTGREVASSSMINAQKHYGLDVLTRITYEIEHLEDGIIKLQSSLVDSINDMLKEACEDAGADVSEVYELAVAANCTMLHTLLGVDASPIGKAPFAPVFVKSKDIPAASIGIKASAGARLYCLPSVSAYIGADIVAGAYVCKLHERKGNVLFIDIGTNGEIVLSRNGSLLSCSCAAGPALEGMNISSGMRAADGAIEDICIGENGVRINVIGDEEPAGVCGSGILAAVKELLRVGLVRPNGAFVKEEKLAGDDYRRAFFRTARDGKREFVITKNPELLITQSDVRQVQLAKGAILSGFKALLDKAGISMDLLDEVLIAGQFGAHLPAESLTGTGILPIETGEIITYVGNTSRTGAYMALMSEAARREMEELAQQMDYMELGATDNYERLFAECLMFERKV